MFRFLTLFTLLVVAAATALAHAAPKEKHYQFKWCAKAHGATEFRLDDKTRVDCLTDNRAIEFDFDTKWAESVTQALHYSLKTNKRAGVVLITKSGIASKHYKQLVAVVNRYNMPVDVCLISDTGQFVRATPRYGWCLHPTLAVEEAAVCSGCHTALKP